MAEERTTKRVHQKKEIHERAGESRRRRSFMAACTSENWGDMAMLLGVRHVIR